MNYFATCRAERRKAGAGLDTLTLYISHEFHCTVALALKARGSKQGKGAADEARYQRKAGIQGDKERANSRV